MTPTPQTLSPFQWRGAPSIFATKQALAHAKAVETSRINAQAQRAAAPRVEPKKAKHRVGRPAVEIDAARLKDLRAQGYSTRECARLLNCDHSTVASRLRAMEAP